MIEFTRVAQNPESGEALKVSVASGQIAAVMEDEGSPEQTIIRLVSGRGFLVRGTYAQIKAQLNPN